MKRPLVVVVADFIADSPAEKAVLEPVAEVVRVRSENEADLLDRAAEIRVLLVMHGMKLTEAVIARMTSCQAVVRCGVGYDAIDVQTCGKYGIVVCNVPDYGTEEVADHALLLLLAVARRLLPTHTAIREGNWDTTLAAGTPRLRGKTLGILGCGRIGSAMALRGKALGMRVVCYDPYQPDGIEKGLGIERCHKLDDFLPQAQFLSVHCPLTPETRHILNARTLALLPRGAYVVNTARGPVIDLVALGDALEAGHLAAAGLDVVEREPLDDERIRRHPRVILTPHTAFYSEEGNHEMRTKGAQEGRRVLLGERVRNPVNRQYLTNPRTIV